MRNEEALCRSQSSQDELLAVARALKKQFAVIGKIRAILPRQRPGRKADLFILKAAESMGNSEWQGKKKNWVWHSVALKAYPEYALLPMDSQRLIRYSLRPRGALAQT